MLVKNTNIRQKWVKKGDPSTMWPKGWSLSKIKRLTEEASQNVFDRAGSKILGRTKKGIEVEFWIDKSTGEITNSYPYTKNL